MNQDLNQNSEIKQLEVLLKADDVARVLNISRSFAFQLMQRGDIRTVKIGRSVRVRPADLENFIVSNCSM